MLKNTILGAALMALGVGGYLYAVAGDYQSRPDPRLTPGAIASHDVSEICQYGYSRSHRVWPYPEGKRAVLERYGIPLTDARRYEDDDLVPVCLGGDNSAITNHWPQLWREAEIKDGAEKAFCKMVCAGQLRLDQAQRYFLNWGKSSWARHAN